MSCNVVVGTQGNLQEREGHMKNSVSLKALADNWPSPYVAREEIDRFTGGLLTAKYCANLDSQGRGIRGRIRCGRKIGYPTRSVVEFMESRSSALDEG